MGTLHQFPATDSLRQYTPAPAPAGLNLAAFRPRREYSFAEVVRMLALQGERRTQISYLRQLAAERAMPLPKNPRRSRGHLASGPAIIGTRSRWCALAMDAWLDNQSSPPPAASAAAMPPPPRALRADLAARARQLAGA